MANQTTSNHRVARLTRRCPCFVLLLVAGLNAMSSHLNSLRAEDVVPCRQAHAHNDYQHQRPLVDALEHGFCSVEADIFLIEGKLLVGHSLNELSGTRTLQSLYLDPLRARIERNGGSVFGDGKPITLLVDLKSDGESTFKALNQVLSGYKEIVSWSEQGEWHPGAVNVIISGNRPIATITAASPRFAGIDGRLSDLNSDTSAELMPLISDNWTKHFQWRGSGEISQAEKAKLNRTIEQIHAKGRLVRFWATPDTPAAWEVLRDAGVDLINTDDLAGLSRFLRKSP